MTRRDFLGAGGAFAVMGMAGCRTTGPCPRDKEFVLAPGGDRLWLSWDGLAEGLRVWVAGDTHFGLHDARDDQYAGFYRRMCWTEDYEKRAEGHKRAFEKMLADARREKVDLLLLVGDIISAPTLANVEYVTEILKASGVPWMYVAGNHDWHFEGDEGSDLEQRDRWIPRRLSSFYPAGADPLMYSRVVKGVRFVAIDDSAYLIRKEQLDFWRTEAEKGDPMVLMMHIPLYVEGWGIFTCGNPQWGAKTDPYWQIERRQKWRAEGPTRETLAFREEVLSAPNLIGVFTGHYHQFMSARVRGQNLFSVASNELGRHLDVTIGGGSGR